MRSHSTLLRWFVTQPIRKQKYHLYNLKVQFLFAPTFFYFIVVLHLLCSSFKIPYFRFSVTVSYFTKIRIKQEVNA